MNSMALHPLSSPSLLNLLSLRNHHNLANMYVKITSIFLDNRGSLCTCYLRKIEKEKELETCGIKQNHCSKETTESTHVQILLVDNIHYSYKVPMQ